MALFHFPVPVDRRHRTGSPCGLKGGRFLKKIPQPGEFNDLLSGQNGGDHFPLRSGVNFVQMQPPVDPCRLSAA
jgi:hypothetical protein